MKIEQKKKTKKNKKNKKKQKQFLSPRNSAEKKQRAIFLFFFFVFFWLFFGFLRGQLWPISESGKNIQRCFFCGCGCVGMLFIKDKNV